jgi:hypothetical protein
MVRSGPLRGADDAPGVHLGGNPEPPLDLRERARNASGTEDQHGIPGLATNPTPNTATWIC